MIWGYPYFWKPPFGGCLKTPMSPDPLSVVPKPEIWLSLHRIVHGRTAVAWRGPTESSGFSDPSDAPGGHHRKKWKEVMLQRLESPKLIWFDFGKWYKSKNHDDHHETWWSIHTNYSHLFLQDFLWFRVCVSWCLPEQQISRWISVAI